MFQEAPCTEADDANCAACMKSAKLLLQNFPQSATDFVFFTDKKDVLGRFMWQSAERPVHSKCNLFAFSSISAEYLQKIEFLISQGSVATCLRWVGYCCMGFVANFVRFLAVQNFENWLRFNTVTDSLKVGTFLRHSLESTHWRSYWHMSTFSSSDLQLWSMILTFVWSWTSVFEVKGCVIEKLSSTHSQTHTHIKWIALPGPPKWSVINCVFVRCRTWGILLSHAVSAFRCLQCFDTVGWAAGRASGL